jgi:hypothetical protein
LLPTLSAIALAGCGSTTTTGTDPSSTGAPRSAGEEAFHSTVKPLFESRCVWCHGKRKTLAGLNLQDRSTSLDPALRFIVPGEPGQSRIYRAVTLESAHPNVMPGDGWGITRAQEAGLRDWIAAGAPWPEGSGGQIDRKPYRVDHDDYR